MTRPALRTVLEFALGFQEGLLRPINPTVTSFPLACGSSVGKIRGRQTEKSTFSILNAWKAFVVVSNYCWQLLKLYYSGNVMEGQYLRLEPRRWRQLSSIQPSLHTVGLWTGTREGSSPQLTALTYLLTQSFLELQELLGRWCEH